MEKIKRKDYLDEELDDSYEFQAKVQTKGKYKIYRIIGIILCLLSMITVFLYATQNEILFHKKHKE